MLVKKYYIVKDANLHPNDPLIPFKITSMNPIILGAPVVKLTPMLNGNIPIKIQIISKIGDFYITAPFKYLRPIIDDIYLNAKPSEVPEENKITFRIISPSIDSTIRTSFPNMLKTVMLISKKYNNLEYSHPENNVIDLDRFLDKLKTLIEMKRLNLI